MSQAEDLLNSLSETVVDHSHEVPDTDTHFIIDPYTRQIENTNYKKTVIMRGDHNSERFTFEVPRYVDGHDMSLCNRVIVHFDNVGDSVENVYSDVAYMDDLRINPDKPETVISSWLIRREATQIVGILSFSIQYQCVEDDEITYEWNTDSYDDIEIRKSKQNGEAAVINYTNVLEQWRSQIFGAGDSVMANITSEGATQVTAVQNESATQQAAIELKGSETLASIPDDYTEVYNMATEAVRTKADGVVCEADGTAIVVADASDDYARGLSVYGKTTQVTTTGKNLLPPFIKGTSISTMNGSEYTSSHAAITDYIPVDFSTNPNYYLSGLLDTLYGFIAAYNANYEFLGRTSASANDERSVTSDMFTAGTAVGTGDIAFLRATIYENSPTVSGVIDDIDNMYAQLEIGTEATTYEPYSGGIASPNPDYPQDLVSIENPTVNVCGKNLLDNTGTTTTTNGVTFAVQSDKSIVISGTATGDTYFHVASDKTFIPGSYVLSGCSGGGSSTYFLYLANRALYNFDADSTFTVDEEYTDDVVIKVHAGVTMTDVAIQPMIRLAANDDSAYEPYIEPQTITLSHTLPAIPVTEGGNYTDSDGQQWVADEDDLERGVHIQRVYEYSMTGEESWAVSGVQSGFKENFVRYDASVIVSGAAATNTLCTHFPFKGTSPSDGYGAWVYNATATKIGLRIVADFESVDELTTFLATQYSAGTPVTVYYVLATPIETPLTAEEIETFKSIKTNYPNTTVLNDSGAWMKLKYNADTKLYINNAAVNGAVSAVEEVLNDSY